MSPFSISVSPCIATSNPLRVQYPLLATFCHLHRAEEQPRYSPHQSRYDNQHRTVNGVQTLLRQPIYNHQNCHLQGGQFAFEFCVVRFDLEL